MFFNLLISGNVPWDSGSQFFPGLILGGFPKIIRNIYRIIPLHRLFGHVACMHQRCHSVKVKTRSSPYFPPITITTITTSTKIILFPGPPGSCFSICILISTPQEDLCKKTQAGISRASLKISYRIFLSIFTRGS